MDYRYTMTSRLIALAVISFLLLLGLLFALGFQLGQHWGAEEARAQHQAATEHASQFKLPAAAPTLPATLAPAASAAALGPGAMAPAPPSALTGLVTNQR